MESSGDVCVNCSSASNAETADFVEGVTALMPATKRPADTGAKCVRCGAALTDGASSDGWCERCRSGTADAPLAPKTPKPEPVPPVEIPGYRMIRLLGRGGMGVVWLAEQRATKQTVAIKFCREDRFAFDPDSPALRRFEREMELAARLSHPHIARVFGGGEVEGLPYCVMEYVEGLSLAEHVRNHQLDRKAVVALMAKVSEAVQHAHQNGIIHRDLKPSNILVNQKGEPKVLDFGLAKALEATEGASLEVSLPGQLIGTPRYMAPEQVRGTAVDTRTDVYALGVILCELLTGEHPHESSGSREAFLHRIATEEPRRPRMLCGDLDSELEMLLLKTLSKSPDDRYRTAGELADDLGHWLRDEPLAAGRVTALYFARKWLTRHRALVVATTGAVTVFSAVLAFAVHRYERERFEDDFNRQAQIQSRSMEVAIQEYEECLYTLRILFNASDLVSAAMFRRTSADLRARHPGLELLAWLPRVKKEERAAFEAVPNREDGMKVPIHDVSPEDRDASRPPDPAPEREEYLPVMYCDPVVGNDALFGFDHFRGPYQRTIARSVESGEPSATQRMTLGEGAGTEPGWVFALAVYQGESEPQTVGERRSRLWGILAGAVPFRDLFKNTVLKLPYNTVNLLLLDESAEGSDRYLAGLVGGQFRLGPPPSGEDFRAGLHRAIPIAVGGRNWVALFQPSARPITFYSTAFLACGIFSLILLLTALLHSAQRRRR